LPHELLVLTDLSRTLREEERRAWQRLVRVLGHEMNNSLAPIKSIAGSLEKLLQRKPPPDDWHDDAQSGLKSIAAEPTHSAASWKRMPDLRACPRRKKRMSSLVNSSGASRIWSRGYGSIYTGPASNNQRGRCPD